MVQQMPQLGPEIWIEQVDADTSLGFLEYIDGTHLEDKEFCLTCSPLS
jgi:hypothetical protein